MPALTEARYTGLRSAREAARVVLAKHPCVMAGLAARDRARADEFGMRAEKDRRRVGREDQDVGGGQDAAGACGSK